MLCIYKMHRKYFCLDFYFTHFDLPLQNILGFFLSKTVNIYFIFLYKSMRLDLNINRNLVCPPKDA